LAVLLFLKASPPEGRASKSGGGCGEEKRFKGKGIAAAADAGNFQEFLIK
jgi:hypothetical protein